MTKKQLSDYDLTDRQQRYFARKAGFDVPKQNPGRKPKDFYTLFEKQGDCWIWKDYINPYGYGTYTINGFTHMAHRYAWEQKHGKKIGDSIAMHTCDTPACCNPDHIVIGSHADNVKDKMKKKRQAIGENIKASVLTTQQVFEMREKYKPKIYTYKMLAAEYGVSKDTAQKAVRGINWKHL